MDLQLGYRMQRTPPWFNSDNHETLRRRMAIELETAHVEPFQRIIG